jgi:pyruvate formate lyase activating enzyme
VRARRDDRLWLDAWGRTTSLCVDPIEKKPLSHFLPGSRVLSFGSAGCNLGCRYCQNWELTTARSWQESTECRTPDEIALLARRLGCASVAFTYNDPTIYAEWAMAVSEACHAHGLRTVAVTSGYITEAPRRALYGGIDAANVDLKAFTDPFYQKLCGGRLQPVLETLEYLARETGVWLEVTNLLIPGWNDSDDEIARLSEWMVERLGPEVPLHFSAFHPDHRLTDVPRTPAATLSRARARALAAGLRHVYTGNVHDDEGATTHCAGCGATLLRRDWHLLLENRLTPDGRCPACARPLAGRFET